MKKYFLSAIACLFALASCEDVPAPYVIYEDNYGNQPEPTPIVNSHDEPFAVADALAAFSAGKSGNFWVKGNIVGYIPTDGATTNMSVAVFGSEGAIASNMILGPSATERDGDKCMAIQLTAGSDVRSALNLMDHSGNLGKEVLLYGSLEKYCGAPGLKSVTYCEFDGKSYGVDPSAPVQTEFEHISIAEFLAKADPNTGYELTGVVGNIANTTYGNFDLIEDGASIYIYGLLDKNGKKQQFANMDIATGDTVTLTGKYKDYNGKAEIADAQYVSHKKGNGGKPDTPDTPDTPIIPGEANVMNFASNVWGLPEGSANGKTATESFTDGTYTIKLTASTDGKYYYNTQGYLMLGKKDATLEFPVFDFEVASIEIEGRKDASANTLQNIYVGDVAVSAETKGAQTKNVYVIKEGYRAAGNIYTLRVNSSHNTQIVSIRIVPANGSESVN